jgi:hypothetical protein
MIALDTGLGFERSRNFVMIEIVSRSRPKKQKIEFYRALNERPKAKCGKSPEDVMLNFVTNSDEDWSFGFGRAQFITGEL